MFQKKVSLNSTSIGITTKIVRFFSKIRPTIGLAEFEELTNNIYPDDMLNQSEKVFQNFQAGNPDLFEKIEKSNIPFVVISLKATILYANSIIAIKTGFKMDSIKGSRGFFFISRPKDLVKMSSNLIKQQVKKIWVPYGIIRCKTRYNYTIPSIFFPFPIYNKQGNMLASGAIIIEKGKYESESEFKEKLEALTILGKVQSLIPSSKKTESQSFSSKNAEIAENLKQTLKKLETSKTDIIREIRKIMRIEPDHAVALNKIFQYLEELEKNY